MIPTTVRLRKTWPQIRADFPMVANHKMAYLDSGATSQKPQAVIDQVAEFAREENATVHRGVYRLSHRATEAYEATRRKAQAFLNAADTREIVFTHGCTSAINMVAQCLSRAGMLDRNDPVAVSWLEHHSNLVPWQLVSEQVTPIAITDDGRIEIEALKRLLDERRPKVVAVTHVSNVLGTVNPIREIADLAHAYGALVVVDGAQAGPHQLIDVQALDADFYIVSCHKMYGPTGVGILYGKRALLESLPPYEGGGSMIRTVDFSGTTYAESPTRFEAGTPNISGILGVGAAIDYLASMSEGDDMRTRIMQTMTAVEGRESELRAAAVTRLNELGGVRVLGPRVALGVISFVVDGVHPHDVGTILDAEGVEVRAGHHCCMPLMKRLGVAATTRASFGIYSDESDVGSLIRGVEKVREIFA